LPTGGEYPFVPRLGKNQQGHSILLKALVQQGPKKGKRGYVDEEGRIWLKDRAHANVPDHWDVQIQGGESYLRVDLDGNELT
jgi:hypothetical protein